MSECVPFPGIVFRRYRFLRNAEEWVAPAPKPRIAE